MGKRKMTPWRRLRKQHLKLYPECRVCGIIKKSNHLHHIRYRKGVKGKVEQPGDLVTLCAFHHRDLHSKVPRHRLVSGSIAYIKGEELPG